MHLIFHPRVNLPFSAYGLHIEKTESHLKITGKLGVVLTWKKDDSVSVCSYVSISRPGSKMNLCLLVCDNTDSYLKFYVNQ